MSTPTAHMAKISAENVQLRKQLSAATEKLAGHEKRADAESILVDAMRDPRTSLDLRPVDVEDFLAKRAEVEALPDVSSARTAVKLASRGAFTVGEPDDTAGNRPASTGSKAEDDFVNHFLGSEG